MEGLSAEEVEMYPGGSVSVQCLYVRYERGSMDLTPFWNRVNSKTVPSRAVSAIRQVPFELYQETSEFGGSGASDIVWCL